MKLIDKDALVAEIERRRNQEVQWMEKQGYTEYHQGLRDSYVNILSFINTLEVKEVDEQKERMSECPYRQVGCTMYEDNILECKGACSWVVDYPKLENFKAQKGEKV